MAHKIGKGLRNRLFLFGTEFIGNRANRIHNAFCPAEFRVQRERIIAIDAKPLRLLLVAGHRFHAFYALLFEIGVEIAVTEIGLSVGENGNIAPLRMVWNVCRLELLPDAVFHVVLLRVADFHPPLVIRDGWRGIAITPWDCGLGCLNIDFCHLLHLLYMRFDEFDFIRCQAVFFVELLVDFGN